MTTLYDVPPAELIEGLKTELKKESSVKPPEWAAFVKTGADKQKAPEQEDWWYARSASILCKLYKSGGPIGIQRLKRRYAGKKNRGHKPDKNRGASGAVIKHILVQLEGAGLAQKTKRGRIITKEGTSLLDKTSHKIKRSAEKTKK
ncbi:30S ribosomal protein S19e [archaeon]|nr:30S ribosomal protein S19e [archaeon]